MIKYRCKLCGYIHECESLAINYICPICGVDASNFEVYEEIVIENRVKIEDNNPSIYRIIEKCINCGQCKNICENKVGIKYDNNVCKEAICINCGQCILGCPAGALVPKYNYKEVDKIISSGEKIVVAFTSPAVRVALGEEFGLPFGFNVEGRMISALKNLGFNYVFDTTFGADITIVEEVNELVKRINNGGVLPMFTSCCPSWVKYVEIYHPELISNISTCKSPIGMQSALIKKYFSKIKGINEEDIVTVAITPCTAKKMEKERVDYQYNDYVITTSELAIYMREKGVLWNELVDGEFDSLMSKGTSGGVIFGNTGGVMEASLRMLNYMLTGKNIDKECTVELRGQRDIKEASIIIGNKVYNVAVIYGMQAVERFLPRLKEKEYHFIEVMNCPGGCIGGGGQPLKAIGKLNEARDERINNLYVVSDNCEKFGSYENSEVKKVYEEFLGKPGCELSEELLHTKYEDKSKLLGR